MIIIIVIIINSNDNNKHNNSKTYNIADLKKPITVLI